MRKGILTGCAMYKYIYAALGLAICSVSTGYADDIADNTGNELIRGCNAQSDEAKNSDWVYCVGFINGVISGHAAILALVNVPPGLKPSAAIDERINLYTKLSLMFCIPENATREQTALVVTKYLRDHPADLNQPASALVYEALTEAWPCIKDK